MSITTAGSCASSHWTSRRASNQEDAMHKPTGWIASLAFALTTLLVASAALAQSGHKLLGGPRGIVKSSKGDLLEGMMVQLVAHKNAVRTTVYSNADGRYEFPKLDAGTYTLRIAQPREF